MSFTRIKQDKCTYKQKIKRSVANGDYRLLPDRYNHCNPCLSFTDGARNSREDVSTVRDRLEVGFGKMTEVESHLQNRVNPLSECNTQIDDLAHQTKKVYHKKQCNDSILTEDTRFSYPLGDFRGLSLTHFHLTPYLHVNKQNNIQHDIHRNGFDSRNYVRKRFEKKNFSTKSVRYQKGDRTGDYAYPSNIDITKQDNLC